MQNIIGIYKITSPGGKIYIGQSINIQRRFRCYKALWKNCKLQRRLYYSFVKYGVNNHKFEIIHECTKEQLNELEEDYIYICDSFNTKHGLNLKEGGKRTIHSQETKNLISEHQKGKIISDEVRNNIKIGRQNGIKPDHKGEKNGMFGRKITNEHKRILSDANKGKTPANKGKKLSKETREKMSKSKRERDLRLKQI